VVLSGEGKHKIGFLGDIEAGGVGRKVLAMDGL
jgi:hypothetical protein